MTDARSSVSLAQTGPMDCDKDFDNMTAVVVRLLDVPVSLLSIVEPEPDRRYFICRRGQAELCASLSETPLGPFCKHLLTTAAPLIIEDTRDDPRGADKCAIGDLNVIAYLGVPIRGADGTVIGALSAIDSEPRVWSGQDLDNAEMLAGAVSAQIRLRAALQAREKQLDDLQREIGVRRKTELDLARLATTDPLTGVLNRRALISRAAAEIARSSRFGHELGLMVIDLDHFKTINDAHGHEVGDRVLQGVCRRIEATIRDGIDVFARLGGDEFCILCPESDADACTSAAARIVETIAATPIVAAGDRSITVTCSIGVAMLDPAEGGLDAVMRRADRAVYEAKAAGRNGVFRDGRFQRLHAGPAYAVPAID